VLGAGLAGLIFVVVDEVVVVEDAMVRVVALGGAVSVSFLGALLLPLLQPARATTKTTQP
jgi:hypothetical protein